MSWLAILNWLPALVSLVAELVQQFETPEAPGEKKKQAVMDLLKASVDAANGMGVKVPATIVLTLASAVIDAVVAGYNLIGKFQKKTSAASASAA
jgi:hypothetical protein